MDSTYTNISCSTSCRNLLYAFILVFVVQTNASAFQVSPLNGSEMDFWVGEWIVEVEANGNSGRAVNSVTKKLDGKIIHEHFKGKKGIWENYEGISLTVFDRRFGTFFQTWTANNGAYADYNFKMEGEKRIFHRETFVGPGQKANVRMVFQSITPDSFTWNWQRSDNGGESWNTLSSSKYLRKQNLPETSLSDIEWLAGKWQTGESEYTEHWNKNASDKSLTGRTAINVDSLAEDVGPAFRFEMSGGISIVLNDGTVEKKTDLFYLISITDVNFIAYNKDPENPVRIEYHLLSPERIRKQVIREGVISSVELSRMQ